MAEAMYFGLPIVSHLSDVNNGHVECIADAGIVVDSVDAYANELQKLQDDVEYFATRSQNAIRRFKENYELSGQMKRIEAIYEDIMKDPFPHPFNRFLYSLHWTQNIRIWLKWVYLKTKYLLNGKI
jgi:glycosyltransferase involved in cell wall biosynthesis